MVEQIRTWRDDAFNQKLYSTSIFWAEKIVSIIEEPMDIYYLASVYFSNQDYHSCYELLSKKQLSYTSIWAKILSAQSLIKLEKWDQCLELISDKDCFQSQKALDVRLTNLHGRSIKVESSLAYLKGLALLNQGSKDLARESFIDALKKDVHCFEALQALLDNYMLTASQEAKIIVSLSFEGMPAFEQEFIKSLYLSKLTKYNNLQIISGIHDTLTTYNLSNSTVVMLGKSKLLMVQFNFEAAAEILQKYPALIRVLTDHQFDFECITLYITCLSVLNRTSLLFKLAHELVETFPKKAIAWFAVGTYYLTIKKYIEARRYYSKSTCLDPSFGHAWIGFAHSFCTFI